MALDKQIHLYGLDTSCFYTDNEYLIHKRLVRLYGIRHKLKEKMKKKISSTEDIYDSALKRANALISLNKNRLIKEFKITRKTLLLRHLRAEGLVKRNIQSMFESALSRGLNIETNTVTKDIMVVQVYYFEVAEDILKNGFLYDNEKYVLFTASAGQIRLKKFVVIKESLLQSKLQRFTNGLTDELINGMGGVNTNKYLAYLALNNSATDVWTNFNIDKSIVVEDFETNLLEEVDFIDDITYEISRKTIPIPIPHTDGCGMMLDKNNRMIRMPWVKGLMISFPYDKFLIEHGHNGDITDIYGDKYNIFSEDIRYIFTKSQFKMWKYYNSWDEYKNNFKKNGCEVGYCNLEENKIPNAKLNYQMLQTLTDIKESELNKLAEPTIDSIKNIGSDFRTMKKILGFVENNKRKNYIQQALEIYPELIRDNYSKEILKSYKKKLTKDAKSGKLIVNGKYTFVSPDLYAFCEWLFLKIENPNGILKRGEVSCKLFENNKEVDCLRSPHLYIEHCVRVNKVNNLTDKWFDTNAIYTSVKDPISKVLQFDCDGDKLLVIQDNKFCKIAKRNTQNIVPLYYEMKKAPNQLLSKDTLYYGLNKSFRSESIGSYSNDITRIYDSGKLTEEKKQVIKWLCMENNFSIDGAKTLYMPTRPKWADKIIKQYTKNKVPHFFIYAKNKSKSDVAKINENTVNKLESIIPSSRLNFNKTIGKMDYKMLLSDKNFIWLYEYNRVVEMYENINKIRYRIYNNDKETAILSGLKRNFDLFVYNDIRNILFKEFHNYNQELIVDILIYYLYKIKKNDYKFTLWASFGKYIVSNIKKNCKGLPPVCNVCGKRINHSYKKKNRYCSSECYSLRDR